MSSSPHYYNENHIPTAYWLRKLIAEGHLPAGDVDTRSIEDVAPEDLDGYTQHHFFAGIGGWALALKLAGWPVDEPIWTGSCPCQPFSSAGEKAGFADERHLWPAFEWLIGQRLPKRVVGEQVAGKDADPWIDLVQADMEAMGYAFGAVAFPAAGIGSPQIRDRTYWVADASGHGREMAVQHDHGGGAAAGEREANVAGGVGTTHGPGPTNGYWRDADWVGCQGGKWRPVEARSQQMAYGLSSLMGYGRDSCEAYQTARKEIDDWCSATQTGPREALHNLWLSLAAQADAIRSIGGPGGVPSPSVLLAFLRELACKGWHVEEGVSRAGAEATQTGVRKLWVPNETARSPFERGLAQQRPEQSADALHFLSSILARHASSAWPEAVSADAEVGFPLGVGSPARMVRLRGYGNAVNVQSALEFIKAVYL